MILIDSNSLIILLIGLIDPKLINSHKKTSIYIEEDFYNLLEIIEDINNLVTIPNIWTEVDNHLNHFSGQYKEKYVASIIDTIKKSSEKYIESKKIVKRLEFFDLGITDTLILDLAKECEFLITSDSMLSDYAKANGIKVYDMIELRNEALRIDLK